MACRLWLYVFEASTAVTQCIDRCSPGGLLLVDNALPLAQAYPSLYTIFRSYALLSDDYNPFHDETGQRRTERECYFEGQAKARAVFEVVRHTPPKAVMGLNERHPQTLDEGRCFGAWEAGYLSFLCPPQTGWPGCDGVAFNWSQGTPERDIFEAAWSGFWDNADPGLGTGRVKLGYHGYARSADAEGQRRQITWYERRPWDYLGYRGPAIMTEAGLDTGAGGYRAHLSSEEYAAYLCDLPALVPEVDGFCVYCCGAVDQARWWSFDVLGDDVVLDAIAEVNRTQNGGETMPVLWDRERVWGAYANLLSTVRAFDKYRAAHPELGDWIDDTEYDVLPYRLRGAAGGLVYARIGAWDNVRHATRMLDLPLA